MAWESYGGLRLRFQARLGLHILSAGKMVAYSISLYICIVAIRFFFYYLIYQFEDSVHLILYRYAISMVQTLNFKVKDNMVLRQSSPCDVQKS